MVHGVIIMKFERTKEYNGKLFMKAMCDDKKVITDVDIKIVWNKSKYRAYCKEVDGYLSFPRNLREDGAYFVADIYEVNPAGASTFYKVMNGSIREKGSDEVVG